MAFTDLNKIFIRPLHIVELMGLYADNEDVTNALQTIYDDLVGLINAGVPADPEAEPPILAFPARPIPDAKCNGGWYAKSEDTQNPADANTKVLCNSCGAWGFVESANVPIKNWTLVEEPKQEA